MTASATSSIEKVASPALAAATMTRGRFKIPPHVAYLDAILTRGILEGGLRLIVEEPPRHGKSLLVSDATPTWYLGHRPDKRVILCSYEADFAAGWGAKVRNNLTEHGALFPRRPIPARGSRSRSRWDIEGRLGGMITAGIGGAITGRGGDLMIVDDYIKNADQAQSVTWRERTKEWWRSTFRTRLEPGGSIIVMATRWHEDDLIGWLLATMNSADDEVGDQWQVVRLPAIAEAPDKTYPDPDPLGRAPGEALWPGRWSVEQLRTLEANVGAYWWAAMFQQRPAPAEGGIFKRSFVRRYRLRDKAGPEFTLVREAGRSMSPGGVYVVEAEQVAMRRFGQVIATMDLAGSTRTAADWTVITTGYRWPDGHVSVLDVRREQTKPEGHLGMLQSAYDDWRPAYIGVERKMWGSDLIADAQRAGLPVSPIDPDADKFTRALPAAAAYARGGMSHPHDGAVPWVLPLENELAGFPNAAHDDQVDTITYLVHEAAGLGQTMPPDEPDEDRDPLDDSVGYDDADHW